MTPMTTATPLDTTAVRGQLITPDHADYDEARRVWNGSIDRRPALIIRCAGVADVMAAVRYARQSGLPVAVRSGGHSFPVCRWPTASWSSTSR